MKFIKSKILFLLLFNITHLYAQEPGEIEIVEPPEGTGVTGRQFNVFIDPAIYNYGMNLDLNEKVLTRMAAYDGDIFWLTAQQQNEPNPLEILGKWQTSINMSAPLMLQLNRSDDLEMLHYVLGMAQAAAVGYMAYEHIRKYGLYGD